MRSRVRRTRAVLGHAACGYAFGKVHLLRAPALHFVVMMGASERALTRPP